MIGRAATLLNHGRQRRAVLAYRIDLHCMALARASPIELGIVLEVDPRQ